jgi:hypothetical protein
VSLLALTPLTRELLKIVGVIAAVVAMFYVLRWRRRGFVAHVNEAAEREVCKHLRPALELLLARGHRIVDVGMKRPELPLEIHIAPGFEPQAIYDELKLAEPVFVSDRRVLYCKEDWCELHPRG